MKRLLIIPLLLGVNWLFAQEEIYNGFRPILSIRQSANQEDYILGFEVGVSTPARNLSIYGSFDFRPYKKRLQERIRGDFYHQYAEQRYFTGIGVGYLHYLTNKRMGIFTNITGDYTWGNYGGTDVSPQKGYVIVPRAGVFWHYMNQTSFVKLGYEYLDTKSEVFQHRIFLSLTGVVGKVR